jgi:integrase
MNTKFKLVWIAYAAGIIAALLIHQYALNRADSAETRAAKAEATALRLGMIIEAERNNTKDVDQELRAGLDRVGRAEKGQEGTGGQATLTHYAHSRPKYVDKADHPCRMHGLGRTFGMDMLESGVDLRTAAEQMRHDTAMLANIYSRSRRDLKRAAAAKVFGGNE